MRNRIGLKHIGTLPQALAHCSIVRALRHFIKSDAAFVACLVVEDSAQVGIYENVAEALLLRRDPTRIRRADDKSSVTTFEGGKVIDANIRGNLQSYRRAILIFDGETPVPPTLRAGCEVFHVFGKPDNSLVQSAISTFYRGGVDAADTELIAQADWKDLTILFRQGRSIQQSVSRLKSLEKSIPDGSDIGQAVPSTAGRELESLRGYGEASRFGLELAQDIADFQAGKIEWNDVERGVLLVGPPGTGKTSYATRLARACGVPLVSGSYSEWQSHGHQGDMLKAMRKCFREAVNQSPCILLIDEFGAFTTRGTGSDHSQYMIGPINGLLELLDGVHDREGVVVVATANSIEDIDKALLRAGRIDTHIEVELPDDDARCYILEGYLAWKLPVDKREEIASRTQGLSGADLELMAKRVRRHIRSTRQPMGVDAILTCLPKLISVPQGKLVTAAVHESGHALVALAQGRAVRSIQLVDRLPEGVDAASIGRVEVERDDTLRHTGGAILEEIRITLAGMAAEREVFGEHDYGAGGTEGSDLVRATFLATQFEGVYGMGETMVSEPIGDRNALNRIRQNFVIWRRIDDLLRAQLDLTSKIVAEHAALIRALSDKLLAAKSMSGDEVVEFLSSHGWRFGSDPGVSAVGSTR